MPGVDYWLVSTGPADQPGIDGAIMPRPAQSLRITNYVDVPSVDEYTAKIQSAGGSIVNPKMPIPGIGYATACMDTEGNLFGLFQDDP